MVCPQMFSPVMLRLTWSVCARLGATIDAIILKILIEQELGYPTELVPDGASLEIPSNLTGLASVYQALGSGAAHMYPEVAPDLLVQAPPRSFLSVHTIDLVRFAGLAIGRGQVVREICAQCSVGAPDERSLCLHSLR
jgi:hypothetical protein